MFWKECFIATDLILEMVLNVWQIKWFNHTYFGIVPLYIGPKPERHREYGVGFIQDMCSYSRFWSYDMEYLLFFMRETLVVSDSHM